MVLQTLFSKSLWFEAPHAMIHTGAPYHSLGGAHVLRARVPPVPRARGCRREWQAVEGVGGGRAQSHERLLQGLQRPRREDVQKFSPSVSVKYDGKHVGWFGYLPQVESLPVEDIMHDEGRH